MSKAKKETLELESMVDTTISSTEDASAITETTSEIIFPKDSEGKPILTSLLNRDGTPYVPEENEVLPFVYLGLPTTLRLIEEKEINELINTHVGAFYHLDRTSKLWEVVSDNPCQIYVDSESTIITQLSWGRSEGVSQTYGWKNKNRPILLLKDSTLQVDEISMTGITMLFKTRIFGGRLTTLGFEAQDSYLRGDFLNIENTEFCKTVIEGSITTKDSCFQDSKLRFSEGRSDISLFKHAGMYESEINLSRKDRLEVTNFTIRELKYTRHYSANNKGYHFKISLRVNYGHFSGIHDLPFIATDDNRLFVDGVIFDINEFPQNAGTRVRRLSRSVFNECCHDEIEERQLKTLHAKITKLLFGEKNTDIGDSDHTVDLVSSLINQIVSRLRLLQTLKVLSVTGAQHHHY